MNYSYKHLRRVFERTGTIPSTGPYMKNYPEVCLSAALAIEKYGLEKAKKEFYQEFESYAAGWENWSYRVCTDKEKYNMGKRLRNELLGQI
jgi:hypothetical protein